jgi:AcrR family transcriptional regulator
VTSEPVGLRERKKQATRTALSRAALRLALQRGLDNVRVDDIAAEAGVSPRTYNNYFSSREEAICALAVDRPERIAAALCERPTEESLHDALVNAMLTDLVGAAPDKKIIRMIASDPALRGEFLKAAVVQESALACAVAERIGADPEQDLYPAVVAAAVSGASRAAMAFWVTTDSDITLESAMRKALAFLAPIAEVGGVQHVDPTVA